MVDLTSQPASQPIVEANRRGIGNEWPHEVRLTGVARRCRLDQLQARMDRRDLVDSPCSVATTGQRVDVSAGQSIGCQFLIRLLR